MQELVTKSFIKDSITNLNSAIDEAKSTNKAGMAEGEFANAMGGNIGKKLMHDTKIDIDKIKNIFASDIFGLYIYSKI